MPTSEFISNCCLLMSIQLVKFQAALRPDQQLPSKECSPKCECSDQPTAAMAGQLCSFVQKFYSLWQARNNARLHIECHTGNAKIHLQLNLHHPPHHRSVMIVDNTGGGEAWRNGQGLHLWKSLQNEGRGKCNTTFNLSKSARSRREDLFLPEYLFFDFWTFQTLIIIFITFLHWYNQLF